MKVNELRVGNLIRFSNKIQPERIVRVDVRFFAAFAGGRASSEFSADEEVSNYYNPIPITPEILVKAGFGENGHFFNIRHLEYTLISNRMWYKTKIIDKPLKYVHQLQNLYFALTGEELPIEL
jgi:hypothetical protein